MEKNIRIFIVDDHQLIVEAWKALLNPVSDMEVIGSADNEQDAISKALDLKPDLILLDINLNSGNGFNAASEIASKLPKVKIIGLSLHDDIGYVKKLLSCGAKGYLTKNTNKTELLEAIHTVLRNEIYIAHEIKDRYFASLLNINDETSKKELTNKEIEIVKLITQGYTSKQIADQLFISPRTVETHRHNILKKLEIPNAAQLSSWAKSKGYV